MREFPFAKPSRPRAPTTRCANHFSTPLLSLINADKPASVVMYGRAAACAADCLFLLMSHWRGMFAAANAQKPEAVGW